MTHSRSACWWAVLLGACALGASLGARAQAEGEGKHSLVFPLAGAEVGEASRPVVQRDGLPTLEVFQGEDVTLKLRFQGHAPLFQDCKVYLHLFPEDAGRKGHARADYLPQAGPGRKDPFNLQNHYATLGCNLDRWVGRREYRYPVNFPQVPIDIGKGDRLVVDAPGAGTPPSDPVVPPGTYLMSLGLSDSERYVDMPMMKSLRGASPAVAHLPGGWEGFPYNGYVIARVIVNRARSDDVAKNQSLRTFVAQEKKPVNTAPW